jgi:hypothetical protein
VNLLQNTGSEVPKPKPVPDSARTILD